MQRRFEGFLIAATDMTGGGRGIVGEAWEILVSRTPSTTPDESLDSKRWKKKTTLLRSNDFQMKA